MGHELCSIIHIRISLGSWGSGAESDLGIAPHSRNVAVEAKKYQSNILVVNGKIKADAKSIIDLLRLCADVGTMLVIIISGKDAEVALENLIRLKCDGYYFINFPTRIMELRKISLEF